MLIFINGNNLQIAPSVELAAANAVNLRSGNNLFAGQVLGITDVIISSGSDMDMSGQLESAKNIQLTSAGNIKLSGSAFANENLSLSSDQCFQFLNNAIYA